MLSLVKQMSTEYILNAEKGITIDSLVKDVATPIYSYKSTNMKWIAVYILILELCS